MREQATLISIWEKNVLVRGNSKCELPEAGAPPAAWRPATMGVEPVEEMPCEGDGVRLGAPQTLPASSSSLKLRLLPRVK